MDSRINFLSHGGWRCVEKGRVGTSAALGMVASALHLVPRRLTFTLIEVGRGETTFEPHYYFQVPISSLTRRTKNNK